MRIVADFHIHSKYARATSGRCDIEGLGEGAKIKGINVLATGDFTHPAYFQEIKNKLSSGEENGLFNYNGMKFILSVEVACIYKRRMHHIILAPSLDVAAQINDRLGKRGKLASDGRPMLGMTSVALVEEMMQISKDIVIIPAHAWTPWFGVFGSASGVNSIEEAFEDQARHIFAIETGLSSDPAMNWMLSRLDKYTLVSNSDCHSLEKLGREANVFDLEEVSYKSLVNAIKTRKGFTKTYEFYPEEGKYHYDGHRACGVVFSPGESKRHDNICPMCKKPLTIGVLNRVEELADRKLGFKPHNAIPFQHIIPMRTIISKALKKGENTLHVYGEYEKLIRYFGNEFAIYEAKEEQIRLAASAPVADAIVKSIKGDVSWVPGYDGVFGELILGGGSSRTKDVKGRRQKSLGEF